MTLRDVCENVTKSGGRSPIRRWEWAAAAGLLLLMVVLAWTATINKSPTFDEVAHLTSGYSYWHLNDYMLQPENGNLPQRWGAVPLLADDYQFPALYTPREPQPDVWSTASQFLFTLGNDGQGMLRRGRAAMVLVLIPLGALVWGWARRLFGPAGGLLSLGLFAFCPNLLAHGPLVTSDAMAALFFLLVCATGWALMHRLAWARVVLAGLALGGLCVSKVSAPLVGPVMVVLLGLRLCRSVPLPVALGFWRGRLERRWAMALGLGGAWLAVLVLTWVLIWAAYDFRFRATTAPLAAAQNVLGRTDLSFLSWPWVLDYPGAPTAAVGWMRDHHFLPEAYLYGAAFVFKKAGARSAFLNGQYSITGWRSYFPLAFLMKTPLATMGLLLLAAAATLAGWMDSSGHWLARWRRLWRGFYRTAPLWLFLAVYWTMAITSHLNIGLRHMLPAYPMLFILGGAAAAWLAHPRVLLRWGVAALALVLMLESTLTWPNYLTFFNLWAGGPSQGYTHLVDSNLDWGQDLPALRRWLDAQGLNSPQPAPGATPVYLSYFGTGNVDYYGIHAIRLPGYTIPQPPLTLPPLDPGVYCISATMLEGVYWNYAPGPQWTAEYEEIYRQTRALVAQLQSTKENSPERQQLVAQHGGAYWMQVIDAYGQVRLARLCVYLRARGPDHVINNTIMIYRLTAQELQEAQAPLSLAPAPPGATP